MGLMVIGLGLIVIVPGARLVWTGRNLYPGVMRRTFRMPGMYLRLDAAPITYFRTYGVMAISGGVLVSLLGVVFATPDVLPQPWRSILGTAFLLAIFVLVGSWFVIAYLVKKYDLRRGTLL